VVVRETNLGRRTTSGGTGSDGISASVLNLLNQVLVTLLGESAAFLGIEVHVVTPHADVVGEVVGEIGRQIEIETNLVVLESNERKVKTRVAVEEEQERQEHLVVVRGARTGVGDGVGRELVVLGLVSGGKKQLGVQPPEELVVLVNALTTDGKLNVLNGALGSPDTGVLGGTGVRGKTGLGLEIHVHLTNQVTVTSNGDGDTTTVGCGTIHSLLNIFHGKVCVTLVDSLKKGNLGVTREVDILCAIGNQLHKSSSHFLLYITPRFFSGATKHTLKNYCVL